MIEQINLLPELFRQIIIPQAVYTELSAITRRSHSGSISITDYQQMVADDIVPEHFLQQFAIKPATRIAI